MNIQINHQQEQRERQFLLIRTKIIMPEEIFLLDMPDPHIYEWEEDEEYRETFLPRNFFL